MKFHPVKGAVSKFTNTGKKVNVESFEAFDDIKCCGLDCCKNIIIMKDKSSGVSTVAYFFGGSWVVETEAAYLIKVENGDFSY